MTKSVNIGGKQVTIKHKNPIIVTLLIIFVTLLGLYVYKKILPNHRFERAIAEAAQVPDTHWDKKYQDMNISNKYKVVLVANNGGEYSYVEYFKYSAERMGWEVQIYYNQLLGHEKEILDFDPDFILLTPYVVPVIDMKITTHRSKKYLLSFSSFQALRDKRLKSLSKQDVFQPISTFKTFISQSHGVLTAAHEVDIYRTIFEKMGKTFNGLRLLPFVPKFKNEPAEPNNLMWVGMGWDNFRSSENYTNFITLLSQNLSMKIYGSAATFSQFINSYGGYIPPGIENINAIRKNGIYLLTHSDWHFKGGEPSMRLFEAAASNAIVISDKHPFVIEHFGDNFLYFDHDADAETMYKQVKAHVDWIKANPKKAKAMSARAHQIFLDKFTLEKDLVRIAKMHEYVLLQEKAMKLDYNLAY